MAVAALLAGCHSAGAKPLGGVTPVSTTVSARPTSTGVGGCAVQATNVSGDTPDQILQAVTDGLTKSCGFNFAGDLSAELPSSSLGLVGVAYDNAGGVRLSFGDGQVNFTVEVVGGDKYVQISNASTEGEPATGPNAETQADIRTVLGAGVDVNAVYDKWVNLTSSQWSALDSGMGPGAVFSTLYSIAGFASCITDNNGSGWTEKGTGTGNSGEAYVILARPARSGSTQVPLLYVATATGLPYDVTHVGSRTEVANYFEFTSAADARAFTAPSPVIDGSTLS